eukprot:scaffold9546_cov30-Phaeocystis_antarctica.AAC.1
MVSSAAAEEAFATAASAPGPQDEAYLSEVFHLFSQRTEAPDSAAEALLSMEQALQIARSETHAMHERRDCFWACADELVEAARASHATKLRLAHLEARSLQPLAACLMEQRRGQTIRRGAHKQLGVDLRRRREASVADLRWRVFCARLSYESTCSVQPLVGDPRRTIRA